jgi:hypothetical protein
LSLLLLLNAIIKKKVFLGETPHLLFQVGVGSGFTQYSAATTQFLLASLFVYALGGFTGYLLQSLSQHGQLGAMFKKKCTLFIVGAQLKTHIFSSTICSEISIAKPRLIVMVYH